MEIDKFTDSKLNKKDISYSKNELDKKKFINKSQKKNTLNNLRKDLIEKILSFIKTKDKLRTHIYINKKIGKIIINDIQSIDIKSLAYFNYKKLEKFKNLRKIRLHSYKEIEETLSINEFFNWLKEFPPQNLEKLFFNKFMLNENLINNFISLNSIKLKELILDGNNIGLKGAIALSNTNIPNLEILSLNNGDMGEKGIEELCKANFIPKLKKLNLNSNNIGPIGAKCLSINNRFKFLKVLYLRKNEIQNNGLEYLAKGGFQNLEVIWLEYNKIDNKILNILSIGDFPSLKEISLYYNDIIEKDEVKKNLKNKFFRNNNNDFKIFI